MAAICHLCTCIYFAEQQSSVIKEQAEADQNCIIKSRALQPAITPIASSVSSSGWWKKLSTAGQILQTTKTKIHVFIAIVEFYVKIHSNEYKQAQYWFSGSWVSTVDFEKEI